MQISSSCASQRHSQALSHTDATKPGDAGDWSLRDRVCPASKQVSGHGSRG